MRFNVNDHLDAVDRSVSSPDRHGQPARAVTLSRSWRPLRNPLSRSESVS